MPKQLTPAQEGTARDTLTGFGLGERVVDDLMNLAEELAEVKGVPVASAADTIIAETRKTLEDRLLERVESTITYNGDLKRKPAA